MSKNIRDIWKDTRNKVEFIQLRFHAWSGALEARKHLALVLDLVK